MVLVDGLMPLAQLRPRHPGAGYDDWGQVGLQAHAADRSLTPGTYYGELLLYMQAGGAIEPLVVGPWIYGLAGQLYVFDGHHRFRIARQLGWVVVPVTAAGPEYTMQPGVRNVGAGV